MNKCSIRALKNKLVEWLKRIKIVHRHNTYRRPYDYMYDMYYDEFDDASEEDIEIYLSQTSKES